MAIFVGELLKDRPTKTVIQNTDFLLVAESDGITYKVNPSTTLISYIENNIHSIFNDLEIHDNITINGTSEVKGNETVLGSVTISGDLTVNGTNFITNTENVEIKDNTLLINNGETGAGVTAGTAGIEVDRGSEPNYQFIFNEANDSFEIGEVGDLQKVATREASPNDGYFAKWSTVNNRFNTVDLLTEINAISGSITGIDADLLDSHDSSYFATASSLSDYLPLTGGTLTNILHITTNHDNPLIMTNPDGGYNYMEYWNASSRVAFVGMKTDTAYTINNSFIFDLANGFLGIGTTPTERFDVDGNFNFSGTIKQGGVEVLDSSKNVIVNGNMLKMTGITTSVRDGLTAVAGDVIYNTTTNKHQGYNGTSWNDLY